ncbi:GNAT family N-acetyltransferase [Paenibacillus sp. KN14-4R]|uniref:GNAT family N-acetyltransferase n=1 Tax=Paenibacillus sp. KN14-4R TaxID=3445773 RepID=UPI003F9F6D27
MDIIDIRPARKEHAGVIAQLIYSTEIDPQLIWGEGSPEEVLERLTNLVAARGNRYSYEYARVAMCKGEVAGVMLALPYEQLNELNAPTEKMLRKMQKGFLTKLKFMSRVYKFFGFKEAEEGELFVANLATLESFRGKGIGSRLLKEAQRLAYINDMTKCSLIVNATDDAVVRLYERNGYHTVEDSYIGDKSYFRMVSGLAEIPRKQRLMTV